MSRRRAAPIFVKTYSSLLFEMCVDFWKFGWEKREKKVKKSRSSNDRSIGRPVDLFSFFFPLVSRAFGVLVLRSAQLFYFSSYF